MGVVSRKIIPRNVFVTGVAARGFPALSSLGERVDRRRFFSRGGPSEGGARRLDLMLYRPKSCD